MYEAGLVVRFKLFGYILIDPKSENDSYIPGPGIFLNFLGSSSNIVLLFPVPNILLPIRFSSESHSESVYTQNTIYFF